MVFKNIMFLIAMASASIPHTPRSTPGFILHGPLLQSWQLMPCSQNEQRFPWARALSKLLVILSLCNTLCSWITDRCALMSSGLFSFILSSFMSTFISSFFVPIPIFSRKLIYFTSNMLLIIIGVRMYIHTHYKL